MIGLMVESYIAIGLLCVLAIWVCVRPTKYERWVADHPEEVSYRQLLRQNIHQLAEYIAEEEEDVYDPQIRRALEVMINKHRMICR